MEKWARQEKHKCLAQDQLIEKNVSPRGVSNTFLSVLKLERSFFLPKGYWGLLCASGALNGGLLKRSRRLLEGAEGIDLRKKIH